MRENYGKSLKVFDTIIPKAVKTAEGTFKGKSIFSYDKNSKSAKAYENLTKEVLANESRNKNRGITYTR